MLIDMLCTGCCTAGASQEGNDPVYNTLHLRQGQLQHFSYPQPRELPHPSRCCQMLCSHAFHTMLGFVCVSMWCCWNVVVFVCSWIILVGTSKTCLDPNTGRMDQQRWTLRLRPTSDVRLQLLDRTRLRFGIIQSHRIFELVFSCHFAVTENTLRRGGNEKTLFFFL